MVGQLPYLLITFPRPWFMGLAQNIRTAHTLQIACTVNTNSISSVFKANSVAWFYLCYFWYLGVGTLAL